MLAFVENKIYLSLYESYKEIKEERQSKRWCNYEIEVISGVKGILNSYQSVDANNSKISKPLRLFKMGKRLNLLKKFQKTTKRKRFKKYLKKLMQLILKIMLMKMIWKITKNN